MDHEKIQASSATDQQSHAHDPQAIHIALIGSDSLFTRLLRDYIGQHLGYSNSVSSLAQMPPNDLILINLQEFSDQAVAETLNQLQQNAPDSRVALINTQPQRNTQDFLKWPVLRGIFHCQDADHLLIKGIKAMLNNEFWFSRKELNLLARQRPVPTSNPIPAADLTTREMQILRMLCDGLSNQDLADSLYLSKHTIKTHLYNLYKKLGVKSRTQAVKLAQDEYLRPPHI